MFSHFPNNLFRYNFILRKGFAFLLFLSVAFNILVLEFSSDLRFSIPFFSVKNNTRRFKKKVDITCHYVNIGDALSPIDDNSSMPLKSIFFHETSCRGQLTSRQACSVESAARAHPHWQINLLFSGPMTYGNLNILHQSLKQITNIKFFRMHLLQYVKGTPVEDLISGGALNRSWYPIEHTADVLRILTLSKWGGVYLDLDQLVVKSFEDLGYNWVVRETSLNLAACPLSFANDPLGRAVVNAVLSNFKIYYNETKWSGGSTHLITNILRKICNMTKVNLMSASRCRGFKVLSKELFFPVPWHRARRYFGSKDIKMGSPYAYHMFNKITAKYQVTNNSVYARLAQKYCPTTHELYGDQFGM